MEAILTVYNDLRAMNKEIVLNTLQIINRSSKK